MKTRNCFLNTVLNSLIVGLVAVSAMGCGKDEPQSAAKAAPTAAQKKQQTPEEAYKAALAGINAMGVEVTGTVGEGSSFVTISTDVADEEVFAVTPVAERVAALEAFKVATDAYGKVLEGQKDVDVFKAFGITVKHDESIALTGTPVEVTINIVASVGPLLSEQKTALASEQKRKQEELAAAIRASDRQELGEQPVDTLTDSSLGVTIGN